MSAISPQPSFGGDTSFLDAPIEYSGNRLACMEPDYTAFVDARMIRRMSRVIKMGVAAGISCLQQAGLTEPDAIITGTAYGCLEDTGVFLKTMVAAEGEMLAPTAFVHSTHNTIGAQIALLLKCHGYNNTFVSGGSSFENALLDAMLLIGEQEAGNVLVGGIDEITDDSFTIFSRLGKYKPSTVTNAAIFQQDSPGTIAGEGAAFFLLSNLPSGDDLAQIEGLYTFYKPTDTKEIERHINDFLAASSIDIIEIDLLITGRNGDNEQDRVYDELGASLLKGLPVANFKHLSGEYPTSMSFGCWLAAKILATGVLPTFANNSPSKPVKRILLYNHYQHKHHSLILLSAVR